MQGHFLLRNTLTVEQQESELNANHSALLPSFWPLYNNGRIVLFEVLLPSMAGSGGGELTINNNDNKMSENAAASLLT